MDQSLWEILNEAGQAKYAMWVIIALSVLAVAVTIERLAVQWKFMVRARTLHDTVVRCLTRGALDEARSACERAKSPLADVYLVGYERYGRTKKEHVASAVNRERLRVMIDLKSHLWLLGTVGAIGVFVGLLGTVIGIMEAFKTIQETQQNDFQDISGPIAEALIATAAGIMVAIEAVVLFNFFNQRLQRISVEFKMLTDEFLELLEELGPGSGKGAQPSEEGEEGEGAEEQKEEQDGGREAA